MGVYLHYQALPADSRLARRLRTERPVCLLYATLIHNPAGPYDAARLPAAERNNLLTGIANNPVFGSRAEVDRVYADLQAELARADDEFPGLRRRAAYFKISDDFEDRLARVLARAGRADAAELADELLMGTGPFAPEGFGTVEVSLRFVPPARAAEGAALLRAADPAVFAQHGDDWPAFRAVYAEAAARGEAVVIA
jgi:hypothetical protein